MSKLSDRQMKAAEDLIISVASRCGTPLPALASELVQAFRILNGFLGGVSASESSQPPEKSDRTPNRAADQEKERLSNIGKRHAWDGNVVQQPLYSQRRLSDPSETTILGGGSIFAPADQRAQGDVSSVPPNSAAGMTRVQQAAEGIGGTEYLDVFYDPKNWSAQMFQDLSKP